MRRSSALIVGGGPAGAATAITLARGGAMPLLIERSPGDRDLVCGGFLGWDALAELKRLGLDAASLGARPIHKLRLVSGRETVEASLPTQAAGLSRRRLDSALLLMAEEEGVAVLRGRTARALDGHCLRLDKGEEMEADSVFIATGKHELRGAAREIGDRTVSVGLRAELQPMADLDGTIELHLFDGGYAGLLTQEDGSTNLCLTVTTDRMTERDELIAALIREAPLLGERLGDSMPDHWEAIAGVPYGWRTRITEEGLYRVGDQAAVIASIAGDGIAIALASGAAAGHACLAGDSAKTYQRSFARRAARPIGMAELLRKLGARPGRRRLMMSLASVPGLAKAAARLARIG